MGAGCRVRPGSGSRPFRDHTGYHRQRGRWPRSNPRIHVIDGQSGAGDGLTLLRYQTYWSVAEVPLISGRRGIPRMLRWNSSP